MGPDGRGPTRMIWVHEASPGGAARAGASNNAPAGRHRAERVPGDGCSAQMGGKVIAGRRNVRPACRARSPAPQGPRPRAARRAGGRAGTMWRAGEAWGGIVSAGGYRTGLGGIVAERGLQRVAGVGQKQPLNVEVRRHGSGEKYSRNSHLVMTA